MSEYYTEVDLWQIDTPNGILYRDLEDGSTVTTSLQDLTGGRYTLHGTAIRDSLTNRFVWNIPRTLSSSVMRMSDNSISIFNEITQRQITSPTPKTWMQFARVETEVILPDGSTLPIDIPLAGLQRTGRLLTVDESKEGFAQFGWVDRSDIRLSAGARLATADETYRYSIAHALFRSIREQLYDISNAGLTDENGNNIETATDAAMFIAGQIMSSSVFMRAGHLSLGST